MKVDPDYDQGEHKVRKKKKKSGRMECEQCDFTTTGKKKYKDHIQTVHGVVIRCDTCKYTTTKEIYLKRHKMRCDGIVERQKRSEVTKKTPKKCKECDFETTTWQRMNYHKRMKHRKTKMIYYYFICVEHLAQKPC